MDPLTLVWEMLGPFKYVFGALVALGLGAFVYAAIFGKSGSEEDAPKKKPLYEYKAKQSIMTPAEQAFYIALGMAVGQEYRIFAQVRLSALVSHAISNGQNWKAALSHINQKSVDFVLSDRGTLRTVLVIELDDISHEQEKRKVRDVEVERILQAAGLPILRIPNLANFDPNRLADQIRAELRK